MRWSRAAKSKPDWWRSIPVKVLRSSKSQEMFAGPVRHRSEGQHRQRVGARLRRLQDLEYRHSDNRYRCLLQWPNQATGVASNEVRGADDLSLCGVHGGWRSSSGGGSIRDSYHLAGVYSGRILYGESPADLPVQQSKPRWRIVNLRAAKALGIGVPASFKGCRLLAVGPEGANHQ